MFSIALFLGLSKGYAQEKEVKEDFASFIAHKWTLVKAELNKKDIPVSIFGDFSITYKMDGTYSFTRFGKILDGKWEYISETKILITSDVDGIERQKVLSAKGKSLVLEAVIDEGNLRIELERDN